MENIAEITVVFSNSELAAAIGDAVLHLSGGRLHPGERQCLGDHLHDLLAIQRRRAEVLIAPVNQPSGYHD